MFRNSIVRALLTTSFFFATQPQLSTAFGEESSACDTATATRVLNFGQGFGLADCQNENQRGLLIYDKNVSTERDGILALIIANNKKLIRFWSQLTLYGTGTQYYPELLELGKNYYEKSDERTLRELLDYIAEIQKKLDSPHGRNTKVVTCESHQRQSQFCETGIDLTEIIEAEITVKELYSRDKCTLGETFELVGTELLVDKGCRAAFTIKY